MVDISIVGDQSIKLKGKRVTFVIDPTKELPKTPADAIILLDDSLKTDVSRVSDSRIIINGPGGYEVGGAKISGTKTPKGILYRFLIDDTNIILGAAMDAKMEGFDVCQVAVVNANNDFNEAFITALEPKMTVLYGDKKLDAAKLLGAENVASVSKITVVKDKLPEKMEVITLG